MTKAVSSLIAGRAVTGAPGGTIMVTNPAHLDEVDPRISRTTSIALSCPGLCGMSLFPALR